MVDLNCMWRRFVFWLFKRECWKAGFSEPAMIEQLCSHCGHQVRTLDRDMISEKMDKHLKTCSKYHETLALTDKKDDSYDYSWASPRLLWGGDKPEKSSCMDNEKKTWEEYVKEKDGSINE